MPKIKMENLSNDWLIKDCKLSAEEAELLRDTVGKLPTYKREQLYFLLRTIVLRVKESQ